MWQNKQKTTFWNLINKQKIVIPIIQRDYAQGRARKEYLRQKFLQELKDALDGNGTKNLTLDFVYGTKEQKNAMAPLDGQQRLTTLWLLHWYIAYKIGKLEDENIKKVLRNFSYETRISSREFCEKLCDLAQKTDNAENKLSLLDYIQQQTWFFSIWKQDPNIQAMLRMLCGTKNNDQETNNDIIDGIDELFENCTPEELEEYWSRLIGEDSKECPISFYLMTIGTKEMPLSDDLYIKMNARGKSLTSFENFKADLIKWINDNITIEESVKYASLIDNQWTDIFWNITESEITHSVDEVFFAFINRFFYNLVVTRKNNKDDNKKYSLTDENASKDAAYTYFNDTKNPNDLDRKIAYESFDNYKNYLSKEVLDNINKIFQNLGNMDREGKKNSVFQCKWNNEFCFIPQYKTTNGKPQKIRDNVGNEIYEITTINQQERVVFYAICKYLEQDSTSEDEDNSLSHWMRFVWNLVSETDGNRPTIRSIGAMQEAISIINRIDNYHQVYKVLNQLEIEERKASSSLGKRFNEEIAKAKQILNPQQDSILPEKPKDLKETEQWNWENAIINAENYAFFHGAIRFLFINERGESDWNDFRTKYNNAKSLISTSNEERHTVRLMIPYINDKDIKKIFSKENLSNDDDNLQKLLIKYSSKVHYFLMQCNEVEDRYLSLLQKDLIDLCESHPYYRIHEVWVNGMDVLSNYSSRSGYYELASYFIGTTFIKDRLNILKDAPCKEGIITIEREQNEENTSISMETDYTIPLKGLFIAFNYTRNSIQYKFRWQSNDWVDMYNENGDNLWEKGLHSHYKGKENKSFSDADSLIKELNRCCSEYESLNLTK